MQGLYHPCMNYRRGSVKNQYQEGRKHLPWFAPPLSSMLPPWLLSRVGVDIFHIQLELFAKSLKENQNPSFVLGGVSYGLPQCFKFWDVQLQTALVHIHESCSAITSNRSRLYSKYMCVVDAALN